MDFREHFLALSEPDRERFAAAAGTTVSYITTHLIAPPTRRKIPRPALMERLEKAGNGAFSRDELLAFFYHRAVA